MTQTQAAARRMAEAHAALGRELDAFRDAIRAARERAEAADCAGCGHTAHLHRRQASGARACGSFGCGCSDHETR